MLSGGRSIPPPTPIAANVHNAWMWATPVWASAPSAGVLAHTCFYSIIKRLHVWSPLPGSLGLCLASLSVRSLWCTYLARTLH